MWGVKMISYDVPLTPKNQNANIKANILTKKEMISLGFAHDIYAQSYVMREYLDNGILFECEIKFNGTVEIEILDDDFCQHYDYQGILGSNPEHEFALIVHEKVQEIMKRLVDVGLIIGYKENDYI